MSSATQPNPRAAGEAAHTPGPFSVITDDADGNRSACHYNRRTLIFSPGTETIVASTWAGASNGQTLAEAEANAAFIVRACNSYAGHSRAAKVLAEIVACHDRNLASERPPILTAAQYEGAALALEQVNAQASPALSS